MESTLKKGGIRVFFCLKLRQNIDGTVKPFSSIPARKQAFLPLHGRKKIQRSTSSLRISFEDTKISVTLQGRSLLNAWECLPASHRNHNNQNTQYKPIPDEW